MRGTDEFPVQIVVQSESVMRDKAASDLPLAAISLFQKRFRGERPEFVARAPGRVNLMGEHTDYNDGFVLPAAIERETAIAFRPTHSSEVSVYAAFFDETNSFSLERLEVGAVSGWAGYIHGTAGAMVAAGKEVSGWEGVVVSSIPPGAGLSSSASLELASAVAFTAAAGGEWEPLVMAAICREAERKWVGVDCGIMDQVASACGQNGMALLVDCRSQAITLVAVPSKWRIVIMDTSTRRTLATSGYNTRRAECREVSKFAGVASLRDLSLRRFEDMDGKISPHLYRRALHVISENKRTLEAVEALQSGDPFTLGRTMLESHLSLQENYEVSSPELDIMVAVARRHSGCIGARMTGAGFGGCAVAIIHAHAAGTFLSTIPAEYEAQTGLKPSLYLCRPSGGAALLRA
jgi:galactokinase